MKRTLSLYDFRREFESSESRKNTFSYDGLAVLFDYLEECEHGGDEIEFDLVALCCEFSEASWQDIASDYDVDLSECEDDESRANAVGDYLNTKTSICGEVSGGFVYQQF